MKLKLQDINLPEIICDKCECKIYHEHFENMIVFKPNPKNLTEPSTIFNITN